MKTTVNIRIYILVLVLLSSTLACSLGQPKPAPAQSPTAIQMVPTKTSEPTNDPACTGSLVRQWASAGEATSQFGSDSWTAQQAAGAPDTLSCGDHGTAWASMESNSSLESITLYYYDQPLIPTEINIVQSFNPSQVVMVELLDPYGEYADAIIYEAEPQATGDCPYTLSIPVTGIDYPVMGVRISIDQSTLGLGWNEIDAVELVGYPETGFEAQPADYSIPEGIWDTVETLPIFPTAEYVNYPTQMTLVYSVNGSDRQEVLDFVLENLAGIGWQLDVDQNGDCLDPARCLSKQEGLDYGSADNQLWYFIHPDSQDSLLTLWLMEENGVVLVSMALQ
jgi:hypothetical protein